MKAYPLLQELRLTDNEVHVACKILNMFGEGGPYADEDTIDYFTMHYVIETIENNDKEIGETLEDSEHETFNELCDKLFA